jgi:hypothetical protein
MSHPLSTMCHLETAQGAHMNEDRWSDFAETASAHVRLEEVGIGLVDVRGKLCNAALGGLNTRIARWVRFHGLSGFIVVLGWRVLLTANGAGEIAAGLRGVSAGDGRLVSGALVVPRERIQWAAKHCRQLSEHGLLRAAFTDPQLAQAWLRSLAAPLFLGGMEGAAAPGSARPTEQRTPALLSRRGRLPAVRRRAGQGSLPRASAP